ncbi:L,D-transpeptidase family protein [Microvirga arsenatis]|uniref:L,D-transpeptidase family protein n=1 Tax=Microvirga arsenatis TaxID=2692265 RepID=A0ABW9YSX2_9HYPH|nr:murein L,D-transpeptidase family protein [Microvirga arsenatis]NBJ09702.1 L,D-transpeptidase family protein [Microvirga arsenatis]NBJ23439.1 L,D-transpeptidase family protein [Microvirga arsenatis]
MMKRIALAASLALALAACQDDQLSRGSTRHLVPIPAATMALMSTKGMSKEDPILIRAYKKESELEIWKRSSNGKYALLKTYPICRWSGQLGPKTREGDRQVPEGFYTVTPAQMNPNSNFYLSFDTGYPNALDRSLGRNGGDIMVHGSCSSRGCFAMTDQNVAEIYAIAREALSAGQRGFQFQSYPFRMTPENLAKHRLDQNIAFWKNLKEGSDTFEVTKEEVRVAVGRGRYEFNMDPDTAAAVAQKRAQDEQQVAELVAKGEKPIKLVYHDGDTHESFRTALANVTGVSDSKLGYVSRVEGISSGPQVIALNEAGKEKPETPPTALAFASMKEVPASQPETRKAVTEQTAPVAAAAASQETPFYKRMFGGVADLFSSSSSQPPVAEAAQVAPAAPAAPAKPVPQKRAEGAAAVKVAKAN